MNFTHIHVHSHFSRIDGIAKVRDIVDKCIATGMNAVALTDHGNMSGIKELLDYCKFINEERSLSGIKPFVPIVGMEAYCARRGRHSMSENIDRGGWHLILLAKNKTGYRNLCRLVWESNKEDAYFVVPRIDHELLEQYHEGLICCSACIGGELPQKVLKGLESGDLSEARKTVEWFKNLFGDDYYIELQRHETKRQGANRETFKLQSEINPVLINLAHEFGVKVICSNDSHFVNKDEADAQDCWMCINTKKKVEDKDRIRFSKQEWLKSPEEMEAIFCDIPEALSNTQEIVDKIELYDIDHAPILPKLDLPLPPKDYLNQQVIKGGIERYGNDFVHSMAFVQRAETELNILCSNENVITYLLIIADLVNAAREMGIMVGPGRSSAAGSLVNYCLKITDIDPLKYGLLFERFYSDTDALPDIDIEVDDSKREKIIDYLSRKYGEMHVGPIISLYKHRGNLWMLRRIGEALCVPEERVEELREYFNNDAFKYRSKDFAHVWKQIKNDNQVLKTNERKMLKYVQQFTGIGVNISYTCGIAICGDELPNLVPLSDIAEFNSRSSHIIVTGYAYNELESIGVVKLDILGLQALTIIKECLRKIKQVHGKDLDMNAIPMEDKETFCLFQEGLTAGVFQFESRGIQDVLRELHPDNFEELVAVNTMYRPEPEIYIRSFINRKRGTEPISYELPVMEKFLKETYGLILYQEQLMQVYQEVAGFTPEESNQFRKDSGRLCKSPLAEIWKRKFIDGGMANGFNEKALTNIWMKWEESRLYAFNKSHVVCYTWLAYQMAYLKAHYLEEFVLASISVKRDHEINSGIRDLLLDYRNIVKNQCFAMSIFE